MAPHRGRLHRRRSVPAAPGGHGRARGGRRYVSRARGDGPCPPPAPGTGHSPGRDGRPGTCRCYRLPAAPGAMLILRCPARLQCLEDALRRSLPRALPVYGAVLNINRGNPGDFEVAVDAWPDFGAVLARRSGEAPVDDCYWNLQAAFYRDVGAYRALLETPGCLRWDAAFHIFGLQDGVATVSQDIAAAKGVELEVTEYYTYLHPDPSTLPEPQLDPDVRVGTLSPAHAELLDATWAYGGNARSRQYLGELLERFPSLCLLDRAGEPLCWVLTDGFAAGAHGFTLPSQRRRGLMRVLTVLAARRALARGFPTYGHTATGNGAMQRLQEALGHRRLPGLCRFVLHNPALARAAP
ncbi:glycine N-acyltransferase-like protein 3 isoform X1 [Anser cygnoides]|uniref:glycine N-acyltransferase-like protein 3 isoform X1 n=1 Tax=Anser cygnoides TaxID=8845 RepID=UPI0034D1F536